MSGNVTLARSHDDAVVTLTLDRHPGNVLDIATCREFEHQVKVAAGDRDARLLVVRGAGRHFCFGASVEDHLPESAPEMLGAIGGVLRALAAFPYPSVAAVQGSCLGGGLEVALACGQVIAQEDAVFAAAEVRLGVFAPAATAFLQRGISTAISEEILLTGRDFSAREALRWGLINQIAPNGGLDEVVDAWAQEYFTPRSAASMRVATAALRTAWKAGFEQRLAAVERVYLTELLQLSDGSEGIRAFIEKRRPRWENS